MKPSKGSIIIWANVKNGKLQSTGHAGIVLTDLKDNFFDTFEGNTNAAGSSEGDIAAMKTRKYITSFKPGYTGFVIKGIINPPMA
jgi:hypothetical protein